MIEPLAGATDFTQRGGSVAPPSTKSLRSANFALAVFLVAYILSFVDRQILSLMVGPIKQDLAISDLQMGLLQGLAFALLYALVGIPIGLLADRISRRWIIAVGIIFWSVCTGLCGAANNFSHLFLARMGVGVGEAALSPAAHSSLSDAFPPERLARAMAIYGLGITVGSGVALIIGGSVVDAIASSGDVVAPILGRLRAWQAAFISVSIPGVLVAIMVLLTREPRRRARQASQRRGLVALFTYLKSEWRVFGPIYGNSILLAILGLGIPAWYPTLLIRDFGLTAGDAANYLGVVYLIFGSAGSLAAGFLSERLARRGRRDANLHVVTIISLAIMIPGTLAPLMPTPELVMVTFIPFCFLYNGYFGCSVAAIQLATPNQLRATNAALFLLANSLIGLSLGTLMVPLIDRALFGGTGAFGSSLALIAFVCSVAAGILGWAGRRHYGRAVATITHYSE